MDAAFVVLLMHRPDKNHFDRNSSSGGPWDGVSDPPDELLLSINMKFRTRKNK